MASGVVFVGEDFDDEMYMWPGRWSAHWESDDGQQWRQGPEGVSAQEAIAWGREHADFVVIRPGDSDTHYSAGRRVPEPDASSDYPPWPEGQELPRRRAAGRDYIDRSPDAPPIVWRVSTGGDVPTASVARFVNDYLPSL